MKKLLSILAISVFAINVHGQIIITGFMPSPKRTAANQETNMEYVQLMATQDITFGTGQDSYTVVICRNGGAQPDGWATSAQTYSFALTSGSVRKGEYFYVGGTEKLIAGAVTKDGTVIKSTDISETAAIPSNRAKWIRVKNYTGGGGDVVGNTINATVGDMIQGWTDVATSNNDNSDGIAVFAGATISPATAPIDVVFYGSKVGGSGARTVNGNFAGYALPLKNDHYEATTGQLYFGQGTNTFFFNPAGLIPTIAGTNNGVFFKLEGNYNPVTNVWITPRSLKLIPLYQDNGTTVTWGSLADIEQNVTLPVNLSSFTGSKRQTGDVELTWTTASEQNNIRFDIYRASADKDFKLIGNKAGSGTISTKTTYRFIDYNPLQGTNYYKLAQIDADGKTTEFKKIVALNAGLNSNTISVASNDQYLTVFNNGIRAKNASVQITDILGQSLFKQTVFLKDNSIQLPVSLQKGMYVLSLTTETGNYRVKFTK